MPEYSERPEPSAVSMCSSRRRTAPVRRSNSEPWQSQIALTYDRTTLTPTGTFKYVKRLPVDGRNVNGLKVISTD